MADTHLTTRARELRVRTEAPDDVALIRDRTSLVGWLERAEGGDRTAHRLARRLHACCRGRRCGSAVCYLCAKRYQGRALARLERRWLPGTDLIFGTVVLKDHEREAGQLHTLDFARIKADFQAVLDRSGCFTIPIWAYIDVSWNTHSGGDYLPHWCPHIHFIAEARFRTELDRLKKHLVAGTSIKRPARIDDVNDWFWQTSYACKPRPVHRADYPRHKPTARPSKYWLPREQAVEFALWIGNHHPRDRHFMCPA